MEFGDIVKGAPYKGAEGSSVTIVNFSDFQCVHSMDFSFILKELLLKKEFRGITKVVYRFLPLKSHDLSEFAAEIAYAAFRKNGNYLFWLFHDEIYSSLRNSALDKKFLSDLRYRYHVSVLDEDRENVLYNVDLFMKIVNDNHDRVRTPTVFVNSLDNVLNDKDAETKDLGLFVKYIDRISS